MMRIIKWRSAQRAEARVEGGRRRWKSRKLYFNNSTFSELIKLSHTTNTRAFSRATLRYGVTHQSLLSLMEKLKFQIICEKFPPRFFIHFMLVFFFSSLFFIIFHFHSLVCVVFFVVITLFCNRRKHHTSADDFILCVKALERWRKKFDDCE